MIGKANTQDHQFSEPSSIVLDVESINNTIVISVRGDLDCANADHLTSAIERAESSSGYPIVVSLAECPYCDSTGLALFVKAKRRLNGRLALVVPPRSRAFRIFGMTAATTHLTVYPSFEEALVSFAGDGSLTKGDSRERR